MVGIPTQDLKAEKGYEVDARLLMYAAGLELGGSLSPPSTAAAPALEIVDALQAEVVRYRLQHKRRGDVNCTGRKFRPINPLKC